MHCSTEKKKKTLTNFGVSTLSWLDNWESVNKKNVNQKVKIKKWNDVMWLA